MPTYCCVGGCKNLSGRNNSSFRHFLRFYNFPKDPSLACLWSTRVFRDPSLLSTKSTYVCSDHFCKQDFQLSSYIRSKLMYTPAMQIMLKPDSVPNTNRATGKIISHCEGREVGLCERCPLEEGVREEVKENEVVKRSRAVYQRITSAQHLGTAWNTTCP